MRYGQIRQFDIANGEGIRTSIFVTGCTHKCPDCFNEEYQDFSAGTLWTEKETQTVIRYLQHPMVKGLSLLGGEPFQNTEELTKLLLLIKETTTKSIWIYSGYTFEELMQNETQRKLLSLCDVLVDGRFIAEQKDLTLRFRGSRNQRILDVRKSLEEQRPILFESNNND